MVELHAVDQVRLSGRLTLGEPPHAAVLGRPTTSVPGTGWKRPETEYRRPAGIQRLVTFAQAKAADPSDHGDLDTRSFFWAMVRGTEYHRKAFTDRDTHRWAWFELVPEPGNPHDNTAVALDLDGRRIGYVPAGVAYRMHLPIRYLNGDGRACYVPGVLLDRGSAHVVLPTRSLVESFVDRDVVASELRSLWDALPERVRDEIAANNFTETAKTAKEIIALSRLAPHVGLPAVPDPARMPAFWDDFMREQKALRAEERNARIVELYGEGRTKADVARTLGISSSTVSSVLSKASAEGRKSAQEAPARPTQQAASSGAKERAESGAEPIEGCRPSLVELRRRQVVR